MARSSTQSKRAEPPATTSIAWTSCIVTEPILTLRTRVGDRRAIVGTTPLMLAALKGFKDLVERLINKNANITNKDKQKRNCLFYACMASADNADLVSLLIEKGKC